MKTFRIDFRRDILTELPSFYFTRDSASSSNDGNFLEQANLDLESNAGQFKIGPSIMRLQFDVFSYNYFKSNSLAGNFGHIFAVARFDKSKVLSNKFINGQGVVLGNVSNFRNPVKASRGNPLAPSIQSKTWANGVNDNCISGTSFNNILQDNIQYRIVFDSIVTNNNTNKVRYRLYQVIGYDTLELLYDTNQIEVGKFDFDQSQTGVSIGHTNGNKSADIWKLEFTNVKVIWGPYVKDDSLPVDPCTCPRVVTVSSSMNELFDFNNNEFQIGFDYGVIKTTPDNIPVYGFRDFAIKTEKGYRIRALDTLYSRLPSFLNLGIKFKTPEDVLSRESRPNIRENKGYDTWSVEVKGSVEILHDCIEFDKYGKVFPIDKIITNQFLNFGQIFPPKNLTGSGLRLDTAEVVPFKFISPNIENQRTFRKNIYFVFNLKEVTYFLNSGAAEQKKFVVANNVEIEVNIPVDIDQTDCCGDNINQLPSPPPTSILPTVVSDRLVFNINYDVGVKKPITWTGGNGKVTAVITPDLPKGLVFNKSTAEITGKPISVSPPTNYTITFKDIKNETASAELTIKVDSGVPS